MQLLLRKINYLQERAQRENKKIIFDFLQEYKLPHTLEFGYIKNSYGPPNKPKKLIKKSCTFPDNKITLYPDYKVSPGTIYIKTKKESAGYALSFSSHELANIKIYQYKSSKNWLEI